MAEFIVHSVPGSPFGRAVLAALEEKGADYRFAAVPPGGMKVAPHIGRHPFGRVPVLEHDGFSLYETQAILRYLDRVLPQPALTPGDPKDAARMDQVMNVNDWYLFQGVGNVIGFQRIVGRACSACRPTRTPSPPPCRRPMRCSANWAASSTASPTWPARRSALPT